MLPLAAESLRHQSTSARAPQRQRMIVVYTFQEYKASERRMQAFTTKYTDKIQGVLSGFDRLIFRRSLRKIAYTFGLNSYLWANHVLLKDFGSHAYEISERVKTAALRCVQESGRPIQYLPSSKDDKEEIARASHNRTTSQKARSAPSQCWRTYERVIAAC